MRSFVPTQVAGRAGRFFPDGKVFVQTYSPEREPILLSVNNEIQKFYDMELESRKILNFPPFSRLIRLVFRAPTMKQAEEAAAGASEILRQIIYALYNKPLTQNWTEKHKEAAGNTEILGPAECPLSKISSNYRWQIILRGQNIAILQTAARELLFNYQRPSDVYIESDVDPVTLL